MEKIYGMHKLVGLQLFWSGTPTFSSGTPTFWQLGVLNSCFQNPSESSELLPQLLVEQFDTLPIQCRHIEHMHEGIWFKKSFLTKWQL